MAGHYGDAGVAAMSVVGRVMMVTNAFLIGLGQGFQPVLGYNWGAKLFSRVKLALDTTICMGIALMAFLATLGYVFAPEVIGFFEVNDPEVMAIGVLALRLQCAVSLLTPTNVIGNMAFQVIGRPGVATVLAASRQGLFFLPLILTLPNQLGILGVQIAQPLSEICSFVVCGYFLWHFRREVKNRIG